MKQDKPIYKSNLEHDRTEKEAYYINEYYHGEADFAEAQSIVDRFLETLESYGSQPYMKHYLDENIWEEEISRPFRGFNKGVMASAFVVKIIEPKPETIRVAIDSGLYLNDIDFDEKKVEFHTPYISFTESKEEDDEEEEQ